VTSGNFQLHGGWIEVIAGVMFSGKSEELLRRVRRAVIARKRVQVFKSHLDERYAGLYRVSSHDGRTVEAVPVDSSAQIAQRTDPAAQVIAIDEAQFLDSGIVAVATALAERGRRVILAGTDTDFRGEPFGAMPELMAVAELVDKLHAICVLCGGAASRNQRLIDGQPAPYDSPVIMVGASDSYQARCRACHEVPRRDELQGTLFDASAAVRVREPQEFVTGLAVRPEHSAQR
jgi:thymidine kinase